MNDSTEPVELIDTPEAETLEPVTETPVEPEGDLVVQIGDEEPEAEPEQAPEWVRDLRKRDRENQKRIKELEAQLNKPADVPALPAKPKLDDFDYDTDAFEAALEGWYDAKRAHDVKAQEEIVEQEKVQKSWDAKVNAYKEARVKAPFVDYEESEAFIETTLSEQQQGLLLKHADNPVTMIQALAKNPNKADELAKLKYVDDFTAALLKMEATVKTTRKPATSPERTVSVPTGTGVASTDNTLERLREEAAKTGDFSKVMAYKRSMRG